MFLKLIILFIFDTSEIIHAYLWHFLKQFLSNFLRMKVEFWYFVVINKFLSRCIKACYCLKMSNFCLVFINIFSFVTVIALAMGALGFGVLAWLSVWTTLIKNKHLFWTTNTTNTQTLHFYKWKWSCQTVCMSLCSKLWCATSTRYRKHPFASLCRCRK